MFSWLFDNTVPLSVGTQPTGKLIPFTQSDFINGSSYELTRAFRGNGYIYVPSACQIESRVSCRLHVVFRECISGPEFPDHSDVEQKLIAQYAEVADLNNIVVLYPAMEYVMLSTTTNTGQRELACWV